MGSEYKKPSMPPDIRVVLLDAQGKYLAEDNNGLFFTGDRSAAVVLWYRADHVQEQLEVIRRSRGLVLTPDPVAPEEVYETCDGCKDFFMPYMTFFDGKSFLCADCRSRAAKSRA